MRFEPPSLISPWRGHSGDLDGLLSEFFRAELPRQWTAPELADEQPSLSLPAPKPQRPSAWRSRFALAASIALLLGGFGILGGKFKEVAPPSAPSVRLGGGSADLRNLEIHQSLIQNSSGTAIKIDIREAPKKQLGDMLP